MAQENRVRIDLLGRNKAKVTKSSIVEAVKILEQDPNVTIQGTSRELIDKVASKLIVSHVGNEVTMGIVWNDSEDHNAYREEDVAFKLDLNKIEYVPVSVALPNKLAQLIKKTNFVKVEEASDSFV